MQPPLWSSVLYHTYMLYVFLAQLNLRTHKKHKNNKADGFRAFCST